jgi:nucleotide-binding universal stress UspA family protein
MVGIHKILVPVEDPATFTDSSRHLIQQAAWLARRFQAEITLLHAVSTLSYPSGWLESGHEITDKDSHARVIQQMQSELDRAYLPEFAGIAVTRLLVRGDAASEIIETARNLTADLIVMSAHGHRREMEKVLREIQCPVWTGAHLEEAGPDEFSIRHVLCSVELHGHSRHTVALAAGIATAVGATLTLVHITESVETYGPGGYHVDPVLREQHVGFAREEIAKLQRDLGTHAEVIIDSGSNVPGLLNRAAEQSKADVLIIGHISGRSHLGDNSNGAGIIQHSLIPVLSV